MLAYVTALHAHGGLTRAAIGALVAEHFKVSTKTARRYLIAVEEEARAVVGEDGEVEAAVVPRPRLISALPEEPARPPPVQGETLQEFRMRWAKRIEDWVTKCEEDFEKGIVVNYKEVGKTRDSPGELIPIHLHRPAMVNHLVKAAARLHALVGADAPEQLHVTGIADLGAPRERDPLSMSPAERRRELDRLRARREELASSSVIDVESTQEDET